MKKTGAANSDFEVLEAFIKYESRKGFNLTTIEKTVLIYAKRRKMSKRIAEKLIAEAIDRFVDSMAKAFQVKKRVQEFAEEASRRG